MNCVGSCDLASWYLDQLGITQQTQVMGPNPGQVRSIELYRLLRQAPSEQLAVIGRPKLYMLEETVTLKLRKWRNSVLDTRVTDDTSITQVGKGSFETERNLFRVAHR